jgi:hypothetical protein
MFDPSGGPTPVAIVADVQWTDIANFGVLAAQLLVLVVAAAVAWRQVSEARRLREEQARPFVIIDFHSEHGVFYLEVTNIGNTMARDVSIMIEPLLTSSVDSVNEYLARSKMLTTGIRSLAPKKTYRTLVDVAAQRHEAGLPDYFVAYVSYTDGRRGKFEDEITLDLGLYWNLVRSDRKDIHDLYAVHDKIEKTLRSWNARGGGVLSLSPDDVDAREVRFAQRLAVLTTEVRDAADWGSGSE